MKTFVSCRGRIGSRACMFGLMVWTLFLSGCMHSRTSGYQQLTAEEKARVKVCQGPMSQIVYDGNVYQVTATQVRDYMRDIPDLIVYEYFPLCTISSCVSPTHVLKFCKRKGLRLCVISSVYDGLFLLKQQVLPLFAISPAVYGTDDYQVYTSRFYDELTGVSEEERGPALYHYFKYGTYVCSYGNLESLRRQ